MGVWVGEKQEGGVVLKEPVAGRCPEPPRAGAVPGPQASPLLCSVRELEREALVAQKQGSWTLRRKTVCSLVLLCFVFLVRQLLPPAAVGEKRGAGQGLNPRLTHMNPLSLPSPCPPPGTHSFLRTDTSEVQRGLDAGSAAPIDSDPGVNRLLRASVSPPLGEKPWDYGIPSDIRRMCRNEGRSPQLRRPPGRASAQTASLLPASNGHGSCGAQVCNSPTPHHLHAPERSG